MSKRIFVFGLVGALLLAVACTQTQKGAIIGGTTGGLLGTAIGHRTGNTAAGAIIGAAVGGAAGAFIGDYMDDQAEEMERDLEGARVERVGEGIKITFDSGILFDVNKSDLRPVAQENITSLGAILAKYPDTDILIEGHTDSDGSEEHNQTLSERRANSVKAYLLQNGVKSARMTTIGYGETQPVASNETSEGKQQNRRVEVAIMANEKLKETARKKADE
ncbi:MAG: OmpA family protein [Candidatus Eisenbacteria bacterium]|nr:OmpA family protein [Candidatus Eisenbacteria bacterium]